MSNHDPYSDWVEFSLTKTFERGKVISRISSLIAWPSVYTGFPLASILPAPNPLFSSGG